MCTETGANDLRAGGRSTYYLFEVFHGIFATFALGAVAFSDELKELLLDIMSRKRAILRIDGRSLALDLGAYDVAG